MYTTYLHGPFGQLPPDEDGTPKKGTKPGCSDWSFSLGDGNHNDNIHYTCSTNNSITNIHQSNINDDNRSKNCNSCKFNCDVAEASRTRSTVSGMRLRAMICSSWRRASMLLGRLCAMGVVIPPYSNSYHKKQ